MAGIQLKLHAYQYTTSMSDMLEKFGSESAIRAEYTKLRDALHKRVERVRSAGLLNKDTVLYQYRKGIPKAKGVSTEKLLVDLGKMARTIEYSKTSTLAGARASAKAKADIRDYWIKSMIEDKVLLPGAKNGFAGPMKTGFELDDEEYDDEEYDEDESGEMTETGFSQQTETSFSQMPEDRKIELGRLIGHALNVLKNLGIDPSETTRAMTDKNGLGSFLLTKNGDVRKNAKDVVRRYLDANLPESVDRTIALDISTKSKTKQNAIASLLKKNLTR